MSLLRPSRLNSLIRYYAFLVTRLCGFAMGLNLVSKVRPLTFIFTLTLNLTLTQPVSKVLPLAFPNLNPDPNPTLIILTLTHGRCLTYP